MNKQQLASKIWESANKMRSKIEANEYKDYILGFIFYKYLSDKELKFLKENDFTEEDIANLAEDDEEMREYIQKNLGYFIAYDDLFSTWLTLGNHFDVSNVRDALSAFSRLIHPTHKKVFDSIFTTLQTGLSKLGDSSGSQTKAISGLIELIKDIPMDGKQGYDVLGFVYEYLISMFAANAGKKAGEFYTPHEVSLLMSEIVAEHLKDESTIKIYDPTSGSASLLINIGQCVAKHMRDKDSIQYYAQEIKENTYNLTRMNLIMRDIKPSNVFTRNADTLEEDWPYFDESDPINSYNPLYVDAVVSNPPYSQAWDPEHKETDPRYSRFGLAPKTKADYAFLLHDLYHIKPSGIMTIVLPHGVLFRGGEEGKIRSNLIENNHIDTIIGLPANIFFGTGIPTIVMVLRQRRDNDDVLIVDASKGFVKDGKNNKLRACDIKKIVDTVTARKDEDKYSRKVSREEIRTNEYNLNIPRYVDSSEEAESWDIYASMFGGIPEAELNALAPYWQAFPNLRRDLFTADGSPYASLAVDNIQTAIKEHQDVKAFATSFDEAFKTFPKLLEERLIDSMMSLSPAQEKNSLSQDIFTRLEALPILNKYQAYQIFDDAWYNIGADLETIQAEGFDAVRKVNPCMVIKKKDGKEHEIQDGWEGNILPFSLVQPLLLAERQKAIDLLEQELADIPAQFEEIISEFSEEEKESSFLNEAGDFVPKEMAKTLKMLKDDLSIEAQELTAKLMKAATLLKREKELKAEIKKQSAEFHLITKDSIEALSDEGAYAILKKKWIEPVQADLFGLVNQTITTLVRKVETLSQKYATSLAQIESDIESTEKDLCAMLDDLVADDFDSKGLAEFKALLGKVGG